MEPFIIISIIGGAVALALALIARNVWLKLVTTVTVHQHEATLLFRHGRLLRQLEAGRHRLVGAGHEILTFDTRWKDLPIQGQEFMTADKAGVKVSGVVRYRISDPVAFQSASDHPVGALYISAQLALRDGIGGLDLEAVLERKAALTESLTERVRKESAELGIEVSTVSVKDLSISGDIRRVFTEALTVRQQSLISLEKARAEAAAMRTLANGARVFETHPALLQLKFLQTLERADGGITQPLALGAAGQWLDFLKK